MATPSQVKDYLACWFQLGKPAVLDQPAGKRELRPMSVLSPRGYSQEFENCWQQIVSCADQAYLAGTDITIAQLLSDHYELTTCWRCQLLVPIATNGEAGNQGPCPCADLTIWPNLETVPPRSPQAQFTRQIELDGIQRRLQQFGLPVDASEEP